MVLAVTLHNLPEGMVVGLAAALALHGDADAVSGALALSLGIGLQNIPEGAAVSLPLMQAGQGRRKAFCAGAASGLVEPLGALLALALAGWVSAALPWLMSAAAENSWVPQCRQRLARHCDVEGTIGPVLIVFARRARRCCAIRAHGKIVHRQTAFRTRQPTRAATVSEGSFFAI